MAVVAGPGQAQAPEGGATRVRPPADLIEEYPLGRERLCCGRDAGADRSPSASTGTDPAGPAPPAWLFVLAPLALAGLLVAFALYARGAPATAYGYSLDVRPRPRRDVPPWLLVLLRPLFEYEFRRDAWVLRGIGNRVGPVLRPRAEPEQSPSEPRRTGRFDRTDEPLSEPAPDAPAPARRK